MTPAKDILLQILREMEDRNLSSGKTQLIKYLYLVEVEYYRETAKRLTNLDWIFHLYGPYAYECEAILDESDFRKEQLKTTTERDFIKYRIAEPMKGYQKFVDTKISLTVKKIIGQWGSKSLSELLDFVYFETEPMQNVKMRGEKLDFGTIQRDTENTRVIPLKASKKANDKITQLRSKLNTFLETMGHSTIEEKPRSAEYSEAMDEWNAEETPGFNLTPNLEIRFTKPTNSSDSQGH